MSYKKSRVGGQHSFAKIPDAQIERSKFNRSCGLKTTFDSGLLIPVFVDEALPGDTINLRMHNFARMATPLHPILDNMHLDSFFFAVPIRLIWENWQKFNGEQLNPASSTDFTVPRITADDPQVGTLHDYMGIPTDTGNNVVFNSLHHRAYNLIWNEWFRDQNLQNSVVVDVDDGPDDEADYVLLRRGKRHDYFTSCLPWPQKGDSVALPLGISAPLSATEVPVVGEGTAIPTFDAHSGAKALQYIDSDTDLSWPSSGSGAGSAAWVDTALEADLTGVTADLTSATAATINELRQAFQVQRLYERDARGGSRYTEIIRSHFGVVSPDQRLQRPEYLGGGTQPINVTAVPQTSETDLNTPQGNLAAFGTSTGSNHSFVKSFDEHCVIIGLVCVRADLNYQQGLPRMFSRQTRWDYYWPALAHLGEQAVLSQEIYTEGNSNPAGNDYNVFGYQERYAEYRYKQSMVTGQMRSTYVTSLDTWHLAQDFGSRPVLDSDFIEENPPVARIIAVPSEPEFLFDAYFQFVHARPMPTFSVPGMIDHF